MDILTLFAQKRNHKPPISCEDAVILVPILEGYIDGKKIEWLDIKFSMPAMKSYIFYFLSLHIININLAVDKKINKL